MTYSEHHSNGKLIMWVDLSTYCNAGCPQCHRTDPDGLGKVDWLPLVQWNLEQFMTAFPIKSLKHYARFEFCGTWGDPIMNKDIFGIVEYLIKNSTCTIQINTNGSIRDEEWWWNFGVMGGGRLQTWFDVDGIDQEMHSLYRTKTDLSKIKENIISYCSTAADSSAMVIVFKHNEDYLLDIYSMLREWGIRGKMFFSESNRFYHSGVFEYVEEDGTVRRLEQSTLDGKHGLLDATIPIRDHKWRQQLDANGRMKKDYW